MKIVVLERKRPHGEYGELVFGVGTARLHKVSWAINGDGTATCEEFGQMWIQAPWGMQWNGREFLGSPSLLTWVEATEQFGCGVRADLSETGTVGLSAKQFHSAGIRFGYTRGSRRVIFAGNNDWRLPTIFDWYSLLGTGGDSEKRNTVLQLREDQYYWSATERYEEMHDSMFKSVYKLLGKQHNCAWAVNVDRWILDRFVNEPLPIMLVRNLKT